jgi:hypothetical protein
MGSEFGQAVEPASPETRLSPAEHARQQALVIFDFTQPLHS